MDFHSHPNFFLLLSFSVLFLSSLHVQAKVTFKYCDKKANYPVKVSGIEISPYPVESGEPANFKISATSGKALHGGDVVIGVSFIGVHVHSETIDLCKEVSCPVANGNFVISHTQTLPRTTPPGPYTLEMKLNDDNGDLLTCINFKFQIILWSPVSDMMQPKDRCPQCKGEKVVQEKKVLEVHVEKGMQNSRKITFPGEAEEAKEHPKFKRKSEDLFVEHTLSLSEALCGFQFVLTRLDGRQLLIKSNPGEVVKPDSFKAINDEGMPIYQRPFMKGKLYIHFTVEFPETLTPDQVKGLEAVLPAKPSSQLTDMELDECEETTLHDVNMEEETRRKQQQQQQEAYDEDDDMPGGAQRVQCAQQ